MGKTFWNHFSRAFFTESLGPQLTNLPRNLPTQPRTPFQVKTTPTQFNITYQLTATPIFHHPPSNPHSKIPIGKCKYQTSCSFAHGGEERRNPVNISNPITHYLPLKFDPKNRNQTWAAPKCLAMTLSRTQT
jgi:hypothetical protein